MKIQSLALALALSAFTVQAQASLYKVTVLANVDYNVIGGSMAGVQSGAPVSMSFNVDSNTFLNSTMFPTRGYNVIENSFAMTVDGRPVSFDVPQPNPAYFVLRNNDPAIDGVFLSFGTDIDVPLNVHIPGLTPTHELSFKHTFANGTTFSSLNIGDAVGTYNLSTNVSSYLFGIGRFGGFGAEYVPSTMTIESVPEPATMAILGAGALALLRRRKK
ncbi:MAG: PEP-CTERM sorting domain-containing protein [Fimbriimonadaceae bacterium]|nr:PEP-CTERM sorting domain-containing protein [Fimbriimonadaceae bacterium]